MSNFRTATTPGEALAVMVICFGWPILASASAMLAGFRGGEFSDGSLIGLIFEELVLGSVAMAVLAVRGYDFRALYPRPTWVCIGLALVFVCRDDAGFVGRHGFVSGAVSITAD